MFVQKMSDVCTVGKKDSVSQQGLAPGCYVALQSLINYTGSACFLYLSL